MLIGNPQTIRTFEVVQYVTGYLPGEINDWPDKIQDIIYKALERKAHEVQLPLTIVCSYCDKDYGDTEADDKYFVRIVASEIVAADSRFFKDAQEQLKDIINQHKLIAEKTRH